ncbi:MAG: LytTR family transcriptional regulator, partial [Bacteroides sp.]|nr:LytTR family transcriptional regulator [Bacteroides sp.]
MKWKELINAPYPTYYQRWKAVVIPSVIIFLILYLLQPFGSSRIEGSRLVVVFGSALISAGASGVF